MKFPNQLLLELHKTMVTIRLFEQECRVAHYFDLNFLIKMTRGDFFHFTSKGGRDRPPALLWC